MTDYLIPTNKNLVTNNC